MFLSFMYFFPNGSQFYSKTSSFIPHSLCNGRSICSANSLNIFMFPPNSTLPMSVVPKRYRIGMGLICTVVFSIFTDDSGEMALMASDSSFGGAFESLRMPLLLSPARYSWKFFTENGSVFG